MSNRREGSGIHKRYEDHPRGDGSEQDTGRHQLERHLPFDDCDAEKHQAGQKASDVQDEVDDLYSW